MNPFLKGPGDQKSPGKRTVSSALNILGIGQHGDFAVILG